jgi:hypothetical protein
MLVGRDDRRRDLRAPEQFAVIGGDEVGPDLRGDLGGTRRVLFGDADPLHRHVAGGDLAAEQADAAGAHDGKPDALCGFSLHRRPLFAALSLARPDNGLAPIASIFIKFESSADW